MSVTTLQQRPANPADVLRTQLRKMEPEFRNALPSHIKPEKFQRVVMTVVQQQPDLLAADRATLLAACTKCAADGLIPDGREAALVIFNTKKKVNGQDQWVKAVQYMPMMGGILKRIRNSGEVASVQAHVIYEHDKFVIRRGLNETIEHEPKFPGDRGKPIGAYAVAKFKDGSDPVFEVMDIEQINKVRSVSRSKDSGPWVAWWDEMAKKSVFRRLSKWLPMDADVDDVIRRDDDAGTPTQEGGPTINGEVEPVATLPASKLDALEGTIDGSFDEETGEITTESEPPPDPDQAAAADILGQLAACTNQAAHDALFGNAAVTSTVERLKRQRPELYRQIIDAAREKTALYAQTRKPPSRTEKVSAADLNDEIPI